MRFAISLPRWHHGRMTKPLVSSDPEVSDVQRRRQAVQIAGMGAAAGRLDTLCGFLAPMPSRTGMASIAMQRQARDGRCCMVRSMSCRTVNRVIDGPVPALVNVAAMQLLAPRLAPERGSSK
jgi:hypothetical protein